MNRITAIAAALVCGLGMSAQDGASQDEYSEDFLKPAKASSVEVVEAYNNNVHKLFIGENNYDFSYIVEPSLMSEYCLAYDKEAGELVYKIVTGKNVWSVTRDGEGQYSAEETTLKVPEAVGTSLSTLVMLATESSKLFDPANDVFGLDGVTYEFTHSNGITAECWSPRNGNCRQLVDMMETVCQLVKENKADDIMRLTPSVYGLINGFLQVMPGRTLE
ncbi:MAG: hypothetical protein MJY77_04930 [Bacteroidaceae bacterium]|nr:hypothetical protein [Bacteroidaceae bacterium]